MMIMMLLLNASIKQFYFAMLLLTFTHHWLCCRSSWTTPGSKPRSRRTTDPSLTTS